jgi:hypothetical protein
MILIKGERMAHVQTSWQKDPVVRGRLAKALVGASPFVFAAGCFLGVSGGHGKIAAGLMIASWLMSITGLYAFGALENLALYRLLDDLPTSRLRSASQGYVELRGTVLPSADTIRCGKCAKPCLWFEYYTRRSEMRVTPTGRTPDIWLDDGTGRCRIIAEGADLWSARRGESRHAHIEPGDELHVLGEFRTQAEELPPPAPGMPPTALELRGQRDPRRLRVHVVRQRLNRLKADQARMDIIDVNKDGRVDTHEWEAAVKATWHGVERDEAQGKALLGIENVVALPRSERDRLPFVIFIGSEEEARESARFDMLRRAAIAVALTIGFAIVMPSVT